MKGLIFFTGFFVIYISAFSQTGCINGDCSNGNGTYKWENGDMYSGTWKDGVRTGYGRYDWADGSYYVGNFLNSLLDGEGAYYAVSGTEMVGWFANNEYKGKEKPISVGASTVNGASSTTGGTSVTGENNDTSWAALLQEMETSKLKEDEAKKLGLAQASFYDFPTLAGIAINAFANNFETLKGPERISVLDISSSWYSTVFSNGSEEAVVTGGFLTKNNSWYNVLYTSKSKEDAMANYVKYVKEFNEKVTTECCTMVYDKYDDFVSENYESYGTYWMPFLMKDGYDNSTYKDILIEISMNSQILEDGYEVIFRVSHLSDRTRGSD
ncbi:MAG: hypothetical protein ACKVPJ_11820 [Chitinophagales bacterium]